MAQDDRWDTALVKVDGERREMVFLTSYLTWCAQLMSENELLPNKVQWIFLTRNFAA